MKTAQRMHFTSYFTGKTETISKRIPPDLIQMKLIQLRTGDQKVRDEFISNYLGMVFAIVARTITYSGINRNEELLSIGILTLVEILEGIRIGTKMQKHNNIDAYIHKTIFYELLEFIQTDYLIRPPLHSKWLQDELKKHGTEKIKDLFYIVEYFEISTYNEYDGAIWGLSTPSPQKLREVIDLLESDYFTTIEKTIIQMRIEGATLQEIGKVLGISHVAVLKRLKSRIIPQLQFLLGIT